MISTTYSAFTKQAELHVWIASSQSAGVFPSLRKRLQSSRHVGKQVVQGALPVLAHGVSHGVDAVDLGRESPWEVEPQRRIGWALRWPMPRSPEPQADCGGGCRLRAFPAGYRRTEISPMRPTVVDGHENRSSTRHREQDRDHGRDDMAVSL